MGRVLAQRAVQEPAPPSARVPARALVQQRRLVQARRLAPVRPRVRAHPLQSKLARRSARTSGPIAIWLHCARRLR
jgi:hypothetical protein